MTTLREEDELFGANLSMDFYLSASSSTPKHRPWLSRSSSAPRQPFELLDDVPPAKFQNEVIDYPRYPVDELYPAVDESGNGEPTGWYEEEEDLTNAASTISHNSFSLSAREFAEPAVEKSRYPIDDEFALHFNDGVHHHLHEKDGRLGTITESRSGSDSDISEYQPMNKNEDEDNGDIYSVQDSINQNEWKDKSAAVDNNRFRYAYDDDFSANCDFSLKRDYDKMMNKTSIRRNTLSLSSFDCMYNDEMMELDIPRTGVELNDSDIIRNETNRLNICEKASLADETAIDKSAEVGNLATPAPLQTNITSTSVVTQTSVSPQEVYTYTPNSSSFPKTSSCSSPSPGGEEAYLVPPPQIHRTSTLGSDIFCIHGTDSGLSSVVGDNICDLGKCASPTPISAHVSNRSPHFGPGVDYYSVRRAANNHITQHIKTREDPPDTGFGYHPQRSVDAKEPEGYKQHGLFPDIELWASRSYDKPDENIVPVSPERIITLPKPNEAGLAAYDQKYFKVIKAMNDTDDGSSDSCENDPFPATNNGSSRPHQSRTKDEIKSSKSHQKHAQSETSVDVMFLNDDDSSTGPSDENATEFFDNGDGISVISDESEIGMLAKQQYHHHQFNQHRQNQRQNHLHQRAKKSKKSYYQVKRKDSMESDINIDFSALHTANTGSNSENLLVRPYSNIKQSDSMEKELSIDFDKHVSHEGDDNDEDYDDDDDDDDELSEERHFQSRSHHSYLDSTSDKIASPPMIQRKPFSFDRTDDDPIIERDHFSESNDDNVVRFTDFEVITSVVPERSDRDDDGKSEDSNKPIIYPCKATSQMNVRRTNEIDESINEADDLLRLVCDHLARGRNNDALIILTEMLQLVQRSAHDAKIKLRNFHFQKDREFENAVKLSRLDRDEVEDQLESTLQNSASEMANVLNNIGVVLEMKREYQLAMNSYQDALDMYRNTCRRYENAGDPEVDRTVNNIMQLSIAMRYHDRRMELHSEADKLAAQIELALHSDNHLCTELRIERLNVLMCVLDLEVESLGQDHPGVGFTLLKKGALHLEMMHVDMAIKDTKDAVGILKKGLGSFHPEVGFALIKLGDMFNYDISKYGGGLNGGDDSKNMALSLYREALIPLRESFGAVNSYSGLTNNCIGMLYSSKGKAKHAMSSFYDALASYGVRERTGKEMEANDERKSSYPDVFFVWINVGCLHMTRKEWQLALQSYLKAHSAFRCLNDEEKQYLPPVASKRLMKNALTMSKCRLNTDDDINWADFLHASLLQSIGKAQSMMHRYGNAIDSLEEALLIHQVFALRTAGKTHGLRSSQDMARILENLGDVLMISGDLTSALTRYIESLNLLRSNVSVGHSSIEIALVLGGIGQVHLKKGEYAEAKVVLKESMRMFEKIGKILIRTFTMIAEI